MHKFFQKTYGKLIIRKFFPLTHAAEALLNLSKILNVVPFENAEILHVLQFFICQYLYNINKASFKKFSKNQLSDKGRD